MTTRGQVTAVRRGCVELREPSGGRTWTLTGTLGKVAVDDFVEVRGVVGAPGSVECGPGRVLSVEEAKQVDYPEDLTVPPPGKQTVRTLTGVVQPGIEQGCMTFTADNGDGLFVFVGDHDAHARARALQGGTRVRVTGTVRADLMTTCQQGGAFEITNLTTLP